jgi:uncharacterized metal-binding protein
MNCAECDNKECYQGKDCTGLAGELLPRYGEKETRLVHDLAAEIEKNFYMKITRIAELIEYIKARKIKRLGIAFCIGLSEEARTAAKIFSRHCKVHSVCCKVCGIPKSKLGQPHLREGGHESICNPVGQAEVLNRADTELNLMLGLCVGHDILFIRHSKADVSPLVVKDRVLAHNPVGALYSRYYKNRLMKT